MAKGKSEAQTAATAAAERAEESLRRAIGGNSGVKPPSKDAAFKALDAAFLNEASVDERLGKRRDGITKDKRAATEKTIFAMAAAFASDPDYTAEMMFDYRWPAEVMIDGEKKRNPDRPGGQSKDNRLTEYRTLQKVAAFQFDKLTPELWEQTGSLVKWWQVLRYMVKHPAATGADLLAEKESRDKNKPQTKAGGDFAADFERSMVGLYQTAPEIFAEAQAHVAAAKAIFDAAKKAKRLQTAAEIRKAAEAAAKGEAPADDDKPLSLSDLLAAN